MPRLKLRGKCVLFSSFSGLELFRVDGIKQSYRLPSRWKMSPAANVTAATITHCRHHHYYRVHSYSFNSRRGLLATLKLILPSPLPLATKLCTNRTRILDCRNISGPPAFIHEFAYANKIDWTSNALHCMQYQRPAYCLEKQTVNLRVKEPQKCAGNVVGCAGLSTRRSRTLTFCF